MKKTLLATALLCLAGLPALAQEEVTCGDFTLMDNTKQMETIAAIDAQVSQMGKETQLEANQVHDKLVADCKDKVDVLVIDLVKNY